MFAPMSLWITVNGASVYSFGTFEIAYAQHVLTCIRPIAFCARDELGLLVVNNPVKGTPLTEPTQVPLGGHTQIDAPFHLHCDFLLDHSFTIHSHPVPS